MEVLIERIVIVNYFYPNYFGGWIIWVGHFWGEL